MVTLNKQGNYICPDKNIRILRGNCLVVSSGYKLVCIFSNAIELLLLSSFPVTYFFLFFL